MKHLIVVFSLVLLSTAAAGELTHGAFLETPPPGSTITYKPMGGAGKPDGGGSATSSDLTAQMPPVMNQGGINSCVSCAVGYAEKSYLEGISGTTFCPNYMYNQINGGVDGGSFVTDNYLVLVSRGITTSTDQPYDAIASHVFNWPTQTHSVLTPAPFETSHLTPSRARRQSSCWISPRLRRNLPARRWYWV